MKTCYKCRVDRELSEFYKDSRRPDGKGNMCKPCYRLYYLANKERRNAYQREYWAHNRPKRAELERQRRARRTTSDVEKFTDQEIYHRDNYVCHICNEWVDPADQWPHRLSASLDHIIPLSKGGSHTRDNVAIAHLCCNLSKGARPLDVHEGFEHAC